MEYAQLVKRIENQAHLGRVIAHEIESVARRLPLEDKDIVNAFALRIRLCNTTENSWIDEAATRHPDGRLYHQTGRIWRCSSKLCPSCLAHQCRRTRRKAMEALKRQQLRSGEYYHFITMTIPNIGLPLAQSREIVNRAWQLFRKRSYCVASLKGGLKAEEFTLTQKGIHYHLHLIVRSKALYYLRFRELWTNCVGIAFAEAKLDFVVNNKDGLLSCKIKRVTPNYRTVAEVCKYVTKSNTWKKLPDQTILELASKLRWNRMFELFGSFSERNTDEDIRKALPDVKTILDTRSITDGTSIQKRSSWRTIVQTRGFEAYHSYLLEHVTDLILYETRRFQADETTKFRTQLAYLAAASL